jgi:hypothetical protein
MAVKLDDGVCYLCVPSDTLYPAAAAAAISYLYTCDQCPAEITCFGPYGTDPDTYCLREDSVCEFDWSGSDFGCVSGLSDSGTQSLPFVSRVGTVWTWGLIDSGITYTAKIDTSTNTGQMIWSDGTNTLTSQTFTVTGTPTASGDCVSCTITGCGTPSGDVSINVTSAESCTDIEGCFA